MPDHFTRAHGAVTIIDGAGTRLTLDVDNGTWALNDVQQGNAAAVPIVDRNVFRGWVKGEETPVAGSFAARLKKETITSATEQRLLDALLRKGTYDGVLSTNIGDPEVWTCNLEYKLTSGAVVATLLVLYCRLTVAFAEDAETVMTSVSFTGWRPVLS